MQHNFIKIKTNTELKSEKGLKERSFSAWLRYKVTRKNNLTPLLGEVKVDGMVTNDDEREECVWQMMGNLEAIFQGMC